MCAWNQNRDRRSLLRWAGAGLGAAAFGQAGNVLALGPHDAPLPYEFDSKGAVKSTRLQ